MRTHFTVYLLAAGLGLSSLPLSSPGADRREKPAAPADELNASLKASATQTPDGPRFDLDIAGGKFEPQAGVKKPATIGNLVDFLRTNLKGVNFVLSPGTANLTVQELRLRSAGIDEFLLALNVATDNNLQSRNTGNQLYSLMSRGAPEQKLEVFNLSPYINHALDSKPRPESNADREADLRRVLDRVLQIVEETVGFANDKEADRMMTMRFHRDAKLLVVRGAPKAIEAVRKVVTALNEPYQKSRPDIISELTIPK